MLNKIFEFVDRHHIVATSILYFILYYTLGVIDAVVEYGTTGDPSSDKSLVIAAILAPISMLQGAVIAFYNKRKEMDNT